MHKTLTFFVLFTFAFSTALSFSGNGSGSEEDPYQITNVYELQEMNDDLSAHYILMNDIDASETREWNVGDHDDDPETPDSALGFEPVGENKDEYFSGSFSGNYFSIDSLFINRPEKKSTGLFGYLDRGARIERLSVNNSFIVGASEVGIVVGAINCNRPDLKIIIEECSCSGKVTGLNYVGGFCGNILAIFSDIVIRNCNTQAEVSGNEKVGGFSGQIQSGDGSTLIEDCYSKGNIYGRNSNLGGFCGANLSAGSGKAVIQRCSAVGDVMGNRHHGSHIGGFCGDNVSFFGASEISYCFSKGYIEGDEIVGGFCGANSGDDGNVIIENCFCEAITNGRAYSIGGFCGSNFASDQGASARISNCFCLGSTAGNSKYMGGVTGTNNTNEMDAYVEIENCYSTVIVEGEKEVGGFCALQSGNSNIKQCFWDVQTSEIDSSDGGEVKTTAEMMMQSTFVDWDFDNVWCIVEGKTYPQLQYFVDCDTLVSVPEIENKEEIEIYPNPAQDQITVSGNSIMGENLMIYNLLGIKLWEGSATENKTIIDVSFLPKGIYLLRVSNKVMKFIKN